MLTLYIKTGCPFCLAVQSKIADMNLEVEEKNIADDAVAKELIEKGGKRQVPYLVDTDHNIEMYESGDIVEHLEAHHSNKAK